MPLSSRGPYISKDLGRSGGARRATGTGASLGVTERHRGESTTTVLCLEDPDSVEKFKWHCSMNMF